MSAPQSGIRGNTRRGYYYAGLNAVISGFAVFINSYGVKLFSDSTLYTTLKNAVVITACCLILFVSESVCGKTHDKKIADTMYAFPYPCMLYQDTGYQGYHPEGVTIIQPMKKPEGKELTGEEKEGNRLVSAFRIRVEHAIGSVKRMRIVKDECRLRANDFVNRIFIACAALHNFRIKTNPWHYEF